MREIYNYQRVVVMRIMPLVGLITIVINLTITLLGFGTIVITMTTCITILGIYVTTFITLYLFYINHLRKIAKKILDLGTYLLNYLHTYLLTSLSYLHTTYLLSYLS